MCTDVMENLVVNNHVEKLNIQLHFNLTTIVCFSMFFLVWCTAKKRCVLWVSLFSKYKSKSPSRNSSTEIYACTRCMLISDASFHVGESHYAVVIVIVMCPYTIPPGKIAIMIFENPWIFHKVTYFLLCSNE